MKYYYETEYYLYEITYKNNINYVLIENIYTDPRSIYENCFNIINESAKKQIDNIIQYYTTKILQINAPFTIKKLEYTTSLPFGEEIYTNKIINNLEIMIFKHESIDCFIGTGAKIDFIEDCKEQINDLFDMDTEVENFSINKYNVCFIPCLKVISIEEIDSVCNKYKRYDYEIEEWILPSDSTYNKTLEEELGYHGDNLNF